MGTKNNRMRHSWFRPLFRKRLLIILMLLVQIAFLIFLTASTSRYFIVLHWVFVAVSIYVALCLVMQRFKGAYKFTWVFLILLFPLFGGLFYLFFTNQSSTRRIKRILKKTYAKTRGLFWLPENTYQGEVPSNFKPQIRYLESYAGFPAFGRTKTQYLPTGEDMFEHLIAELKKAEKYIFLEYFIIQQGKMWNTILNILEEKAKCGVDVRIIYDDFGCFWILPKNYCQTLKNKGISCAVFNPFKPLLTTSQNNRDHRKIAVIDGKTAFTGGNNLADEYINEIEKFGYWKDTAVKVTGDAAWSFALIFLQQWSVCTQQQENYEASYPWNETACEIADDGIVVPFADSPMDLENVYEQVYLQIINNAKDYVYITTPYLIIDDNMVTALTLSAKSGVDVQILTPHIWDKRVVHFTTQSYYKTLLDEGVKIYEFTSGFVHAKTIVSDDQVAVVGSANLDYRSLYLQFECGVLLLNSSAVSQMRDDFLNMLRSSGEILPEDCACGRIKSFVQKVVRLFAPLM